MCGCVCVGVHWCLCVCLAAFELIKHKKEISKLIKKVQTSKVAATVNEDCMPHAPRHMPHAPLQHSCKCVSVCLW